MSARDDNRSPSPARRARRWLSLLLAASVVAVAVWWFGHPFPRLTLRVAPRLAVAVAFAPDGRTLVVGDSDG